MFKKDKSLALPITILVCSLFISASVIFLGMQIAKVSPTQAEQSQRTDSLQEYIEGTSADLTNDDAILGNLEAKITIVEYSDYQCPFCRSFYLNAYKDIKANFIDKGVAKLIFKDFPLDFHKDAIYASNAAECARKVAGDEAYYAYHDVIFDLQGPVQNGTVPITDDMVKDIAKTVKVDGKQFNKCVEDKEFYSEVAADFLAAQQATANRLARLNPDTLEPEIIDIPAEDAVGVNATPTIFINDIKVIGAQPYEVFEFAINSELNK